MSAKPLTDEQQQWLDEVRDFDATKIISTNTQKLIDALRADETDIDEITRLLSLEPVLSAKILMICNSPFFGYPRKISQIEEAVVIIGAVKLSTLVYSSLLLIDSDDAQFKNYLRHCLYTALFSRRLAEYKSLRSDGPFIAGLFHVLPVIMSYRPNINRMLSTPLLRLAVTDMLEKMNLPVEVVETATGLFRNEPDNEFVACVRFGFNLSVLSCTPDTAAFSHLIDTENDFNLLIIQPKDLVDILHASKSEREEIDNLIG